MPLFGTKPEAVTSIQAKRLTDEITELSSRLAELRGEDTVIELRRDVAELEKERDDLVEANKRAAGDIEHKLGLHRAQIEAERAQLIASQQIELEKARLEIERDNLGTERAAFQKEMDFRTQAFDREMASMKALTEQILARLPDITASLKLGGGHAGE